MDRRNFLNSLAAAGLLPLTGCTKKETPLPPGEWQGSSPTLGHRLRDPAKLPKPTETRHIPIAIIGGGIGGLSAGWKLAKSGFSDFLILELENKAGGNSRSGKNSVSEYPLAAHYLPLPTKESSAVRELLAELGVLQGDPQAERPRYDERYLCAVPHERLYRHGRWQEGLLPRLGISNEDKAQYQHFQQLMENFRHRHDGKQPAFALPIAYSSTAEDLLALDNLNFRDWLLQQGLDSQNLHWYVNYACRDDYGTDFSETSAWAGIHYFACRSGKAMEASDDTVLTTPGGNGWLAQGLQQAIHKHTKKPVDQTLLTNALVYRLDIEKQGASIQIWLPQQNRSLQLLADQIIWAAPLHTLPHILQGHENLKQAARTYTHAPWLVANLTLKRFPQDRSGAPMAWDNVLFDSPALGYVLATHQTLRMHHDKTVLTYYHALSDQAPAKWREILLNSKREQWAEQILADLAKPHPDIREITERLDLVAHGHAMVRPVPGLIWGKARQLLASDHPGLRFAHADISGLSLFEEAQYRGVLAAERSMKQLGHAFTSSLL